MSGIGKPYDPKQVRELLERIIATTKCSKGSACRFFMIIKSLIHLPSGFSWNVFLDDYNGDNFDHSNLDFLHGARIALFQNGTKTDSK